MSNLKNAYQTVIDAGPVAVIWLFMLAWGLGVASDSDPRIIAPLALAMFCQLIGLVLLHIIPLAWALGRAAGGFVMARVRRHEKTDPILNHN